jgi:D-xylose transport system substrate-binding protein
MKKLIGGAIALLALATFLTACGNSDSASGDGASAGGKKVFMLLPNSTTTRFEARDAPLFKAALAKYSPDASVTVLNAGGDPDKQQQQAEDAITQGANAIVLISADANLASGVLQVAEQADVPVVLYDHDARDGKVESQVVFDSLAVGEEQGKQAAALINAMPGSGIPIARIKGNPGEYGTEQYTKGQDKYLQPLIDSGKIEVVCDKNITNWDPVQGQAYMDDCLTKQNNNVKLVVAMNDGLSGAAIASLTTQNLQGKVQVTGGQDANVDAVQNIIRGYQHDTVFKDLAIEADDTAKVTASVIAGDGVPQDMVNGEIDNGAMQVPAVFLPVQSITKDNIQVLVDSGTWTWQEICLGIEDTDICKQNAS